MCIRFIGDYELKLAALDRYRNERAPPKKCCDSIKSSIFFPRKNSTATANVNSILVPAKEAYNTACTHVQPPAVHYCHQIFSPIATHMCAKFNCHHQASAMRGF